VNDYGNQESSEGQQEKRFVGKEGGTGCEEPAHRPTAQRQVSGAFQSILKNEGLPANAAQPFFLHIGVAVATSANSA